MAVALAQVWNVLEFTVLAGFFLSMYMRLTLISSLFPDAVIFEESFYDYTPIAQFYYTSFNLDSICVIALFFKLFKYRAIVDK